MYLISTVLHTANLYYKIYILNTKLSFSVDNKEREKNSKHPKKRKSTAYDYVDGIKVFLALISLTKQEQQLHIGMGSCRATGCDIIKNRQERIKSADTISTPAASSNWAIHCYHCSIHSVDMHSSGKKRSPEVIPKGTSHKMCILQSFIKRLCNVWYW